MGLGERLKQERERLGLTIPAFADLADAKKNTVIDWQKDVSSPPAAKLSALASAGLDVLYVVTGQRAPLARTVTPIDRDRLQAAIEAVEEGLAETRRKLAAGKKAELVLAAYDMLGDRQSRDNIIRLVHLAA